MKTFWNKQPKQKLYKNGKLRKNTVKDRDYLTWIHSSNQSCIVCGSPHIEAHHVYSVLHSVERSDLLIVCLCAEHHRGSKCSPHGNKGEFKKLFSFNELMAMAEKNYSEFKESVI